MPEIVRRRVGVGAADRRRRLIDAEPRPPIVTPRMPVVVLQSELAAEVVTHRHRPGGFAALEILGEELVASAEPSDAEEALSPLRHAAFAGIENDLGKAVSGPPEELARIAVGIGPVGTRDILKNEPTRLHGNDCFRERDGEGSTRALAAIAGRRKVLARRTAGNEIGYQPRDRRNQVLRPAEIGFEGMLPDILVIDAHGGPPAG